MTREVEEIDHEALHLIEAQRLTKHYGAKLAVDALSFTVCARVVTGFLRPNGSTFPMFGSQVNVAAATTAA